MTTAEPRPTEIPAARYKTETEEKECDIRIMSNKVFQHIEYRVYETRQGIELGIKVSRRDQRNRFEAIRESRRDG